MSGRGWQARILPLAGSLPAQSTAGARRDERDQHHASVGRVAHMRGQRPRAPAWEDATTTVTGPARSSAPLPSLPPLSQPGRFAATCPFQQSLTNAFYMNNTLDAQDMLKAYSQCQGRGEERDTSKPVASHTATRTHTLHSQVPFPEGGPGLCPRGSPPVPNLAVCMRVRLAGRPACGGRVWRGGGEALFGIGWKFLAVSVFFFSFFFLLFALCGGWLRACTTFAAYIV